ncbi:MAG: dTDP-4-dehydrorhamnose 3,5-epimerase [Candidatus Zixiibacteriota bacterium]|nr:MAG: dTDP-4-dehydrorhamnose 3,5-epimerase [candidate division Zixibacteria bacterium]
MECPFDGVIIRKLTRHEDHRGWLTELFRSDELPARNLPAMSYVSMTLPGVARGPHEHVDQDDLFCFIGPSMFRLYLWDNREDSPTFGGSWSLDVGAENMVAIIVPAGVVHAYRNIGKENGIVFNAPNRLYAGQGRKEPVDEIRHEDEPDTRFSMAAIDRKLAESAQ